VDGSKRLRGAVSLACPASCVIQPASSSMSRRQSRGPTFSGSDATRAIGDFAGGSSMLPQGLQASHGMPGPQSHASTRWLVPRHGQSGWSPQTQLVPSQLLHRMAVALHPEREKASLRPCSGQ
jgi:hypothetical protein